MNQHTMKLMTKYFDYMQKGTKRIEVRLNDEKRKKLKIGDTILFEEDCENPRSFKTKIIDLYYENQFQKLLEKFDISLFASEKETKEELLQVLNQIYSKEKQNQYGVVGIRIELQED